MQIVSIAQILRTSALTEINTTVMFKKDRVVYSLPEDDGWHISGQEINCSKAPSLGVVSNTSSTARDSYRKDVTFISTASSVAWTHVVSVLKDHALHIHVLSVCEKAGSGSP